MYTKTPNINNVIKYFMQKLDFNHVIYGLPYFQVLASSLSSRMLVPQKPWSTSIMIQRRYKLNCVLNVLVEKICLHNQTSVVQLQKYPSTFFQVFFIIPQILRNVVAFTHFLQDVPHVGKKLQRVNTYAYMCMSSFGLNKGQVSFGFTASLQNHFGLVSV